MLSSAERVTQTEAAEPQRHGRGNKGTKPRQDDNPKQMGDIEPRMNAGHDVSCPYEEPAAGKRGEWATQRQGKVSGRQRRPFGSAQDKQAALRLRSGQAAALHMRLRRSTLEVDGRNADEHRGRATDTSRARRVTSVRRGICDECGRSIAESRRRSRSRGRSRNSGGAR